MYLPLFIALLMGLINPSYTPHNPNQTVYVASAPTNPDDPGNDGDSGNGNQNDPDDPGNDGTGGDTTQNPPPKP